MLPFVQKLHHFLRCLKKKKGDDCKELTNEDLLEMEEQEKAQEEEDIATETHVRSFTLKDLDEAFQHIEKAIEIVESNFERTTKVAKD
jgi:hypothetical protein